MGNRLEIKGSSGRWTGNSTRLLSELSETTICFLDHYLLATSDEMQQSIKPVINF